MRSKFVVPASLVFGALLPWAANASTFDFTFGGPGVSGSVELTYGSATDAKYPQQAYEVTDVTGTFTDTNNGLNLVNIPIGPLVAITHDTPEPGNTMAPADFSRFAVANGLDPQSHGFLTYDNLFWPNGAPQTANDYPPSGGIVDIYGLMFQIGGGRVVDFWSNGDNGGADDYGVAVATSASALDYVAGGVSVSPEPEAVALLGSGLLALLALRRRSARS